MGGHLGLGVERLVMELLDVRGGGFGLRVFFVRLGVCFVVVGSSMAWWEEEFLLDFL